MGHHTARAKDAAALPSEARGALAVMPSPGHMWVLPRMAAMKQCVPVLAPYAGEHGEQAVVGGRKRSCGGRLVSFSPLSNGVPRASPVSKAGKGGEFLSGPLR